MVFDWKHKNFIGPIKIKEAVTQFLNIKCPMSKPRSFN